jgi:hypothetical protein
VSEPYSPDVPLNYCLQDHRESAHSLSLINPMQSKALLILTSVVDVLQVKHSGAHKTGATVGGDCSVNRLSYSSYQAKFPVCHYLLCRAVV